MNECHGDEGLRLEVHSLLRRAASAENVLDESAVEVAAQVMSQPEAPAMPETIGRYRVTGKLGEGGMGLVYEAVDDRLGRPLALKVIRQETVGHSLARERFWREARLAASVNHPHICQIYEVGEADQQLFIAMERLDGEPLSAPWIVAPCHSPTPYRSASRGSVLWTLFTSAASYTATSNPRTFS